MYKRSKMSHIGHSPKKVRVLGFPTIVGLQVLQLYSGSSHKVCVKLIKLFFFFEKSVSVKWQVLEMRGLRFSRNLLTGGEGGDYIRALDEIIIITTLAPRQSLTVRFSDFKGLPGKYQRGMNTPRECHASVRWTTRFEKPRRLKQGLSFHS